jgi:hypothetical protein
VTTNYFLWARTISKGKGLSDPEYGDSHAPSPKGTKTNRRRSYGRIWLSHSLGGKQVFYLGFIFVAIVVSGSKPLCEFNQVAPIVIPFSYYLLISLFSHERTRVGFHFGPDT